MRRTAQRRPDLLSPARVPGGRIWLAPRADAGELLTLQWACWEPALRESGSAGSQTIPLLRRSPSTASRTSASGAGCPISTPRVRASSA